MDIANLPPASAPNSQSSQLPNTKHRLEAKITEELSAGNYQLCQARPTIISPISAVPKPDGGLRLIHDLSRPDTYGVNAYASKDPCKYQTINEALSMIQPNWYMAVVDLKSAYRSVHIRPVEYEITGLSWKFSGDKYPTLMCDTRLPFGSRKSPSVFNRITQAIVRIMNSRGYNTLAYLDDFFVTGPDFKSCKAALDALITLLRSLGFQINWSKIQDPCQAINFLGVHIDTVAGQLSLKPEKLRETLDMIRDFQRRRRASRKQLEGLAGKLNWAAHVTPWGRSHLQSIYTLISILKLPGHKTRLASIQWDLTWWATWLSTGHNRCRIWRSPATIDVFTDSCPSAGGAFCCGDWLYSQWAKDCPKLTPHHINTKELAAVVLAALRWRYLWQDHHIFIHTDSAVTQGIINKGSAHNMTCLLLLQLLGSLAIEFNFSITAVHIPGKMNILADSISRLHESGRLDHLRSMLHLYDATCNDFLYHMSIPTWISLFQGSTTSSAN